MPEPESDDLGRYLEDTITIDWQTPVVMTTCRDLVKDVASPADRVRVLFEYVRDEIAGPEEPGEAGIPCSASQVLRARAGQSFSQSHLLAGLLRSAGVPTGFCYARLAAEGREQRFELRGFNGVYWQTTEDWIFLDASGDDGFAPTEIRFRPPWSLSRAPDPDVGEAFLPFIYRRPARRIVDLLERAPGLAALRRHWPDSI